MKYKIYKLSLIITLFIILFACESDLELENKQYYLHCHVYESKAPKIVLGKTLDAFPAYPFNIEYHEPLFNYGNFEHQFKLTISGENELYSNF
ncbi:MAG: hypothetical protein C0597_08445 [Marinilabiliales bacterium]|nr:MAG: hypothetical protein C0597_08445 [Marinilabiliales bacterium]